ncbi:MAG: Hpt domain-containing protein [Leptospiraceae bacterium]|nr:Hpt domain-containing protein [Leptospiraceae bacterium]
MEEVKNSPVYLKNEAIERLDGNEELFEKVLEMFIAKTPSEIEKVSEAFLNKDYEKLIFHSHTIKGSAAIIGAEKLRLACEKIEKASKQKQSIEMIQPYVEALNPIFNELNKVL